jgi:TPR repeat protein
MPTKLICCVSLPPATIFSVPIYDFAIEELEDKEMEKYYPCCGKSVCTGCVHSCIQSGNMKCPFCNSDRGTKTDEECSEEIMKRVDANDPASIYLLGSDFFHGLNGVEQDHVKAIEHYTRAADLGYCKAHNNLAGVYYQMGGLKKAKFHFEAAALAGHEVARSNLGRLEYNSGNMGRAIKHWIIAASAGHYIAMHELRTRVEKGAVSRESLDSTLSAYNNSCVEMRSEARNAYIRDIIE